MSLKWIVGVEPDTHHDGPILFAAWLQAHTGDRQEITGVHVLPTRETIAVNFGADEDDALEQGAREACAARLGALAVNAAIEGVELARADTIDAGLHQATLEHGPYACIIGRRARTDELAFQRLGPVARRLLRHLHTPVVVVPPDWAEVPKGPILLATDVADSSLAAAGFAETLSRTMETPLLVCHAAHGGQWIGPHFESAVFDAMRDRVISQARTDLQDWSKKNNLLDAEQLVLTGDSVSSIASLAHEQGAGLIVCGSRQLGTARRIFGHSIASELAAVANVPVAIVPN